MRLTGGKIKNMDKLIIVMPAYNEEENIELVVKQWHPVVEQVGGASRLIVIDDGSKDNTHKKICSLQSDYPCLIPITKPNSGHGPTCLFAYRKAIEEGADYVFQTDSDGQTDSDEFWPFWENRKDYHFLIGSRTSRQDGLGRVLISKILQWVVKLTFGVFVKDANTPFRLMNAKRLQTLLVHVPTDSFLSNVIISALAVLYKEKVKWMPVSFKPRGGGRSFINWKNLSNIGWKAIKDFRAIKKLLLAH
jgi:glycosyltransferase involved in cell wall biosynthesis